MNGGLVAGVALVVAGVIMPAVVVGAITLKAAAGR